MAEIKPFRALRFTKKAGDPASYVSPPYDIVSEDERENLLSKNPYNIIRLEAPRGENPYTNAASTLKNWLHEGILSQDDTDSLYIYEEEFTDKDGERKKIKGFITLVKLEEFSKNIVLPHEQTLSKAKADRFELMKHTYCNFSQIYSLYMDENHENRPPY